MSAGSFESKVVLITGGSSGIGQATARMFVERGAEVVIAGRGRERGEAAALELGRVGPGRCSFVAADIGDVAQVDALVAEVLRVHGRLDVAVNNAAVAGVLAPLAATTLDDWERGMAVNLRGVWACMRAEIRAMIGRGGAIVNVSSINGLGGSPMISIYAAAKAGVISLTKTAAMEYAQAKIRVNVLVAGAFSTPMLDGALAQLEGLGTARADIDAMYRERIPLTRIGDPQEAAAAVVWLCSSEASYVTGASLIVDGGMTCIAR